MSNRKIVMIIVGGVVVYLTVVIVFFVYILLTVLPANTQTDTGNQGAVETPVSQSSDKAVIVGSKGYAYYTRKDDGEGLPLLYQDLSSKKLYELDIKNYGVIYQSYGTRWLAILSNEKDNGELELIAYDKEKGTKDVVSIKFDSKFTPMGGAEVFGNISFDGKKLIFTVDLNELGGGSSEGPNITRTVMYLYEFESKKLTQIFSIDGEFFPWGYVWSADSTLVRLGCLYSFCVYDNKYAGLIEVNTKDYTINFTGEYKDKYVLAFDNNRFLTVTNNKGFTETVISFIANGKSVEVDRDNFADIQNPKVVSPNHSFVVYEKRDGEFLQGLPAFNLISISLKNGTPTEIIDLAIDEYIQEIYWASDSQLIYKVMERGENASDTKLKGWYTYDFVTKKTAKLL